MFLAMPIHQHIPAVCKYKLCISCGVLCHVWNTAAMRCFLFYDVVSTSGYTASHVRVLESTELEVI